MHLASNLHKKAFFKILTGLVSVVVIGILAFSPLQPLLTIQPAHAQETTPPPPEPPTPTTRVEETSCGISGGEEFAMCISNVVYVFTVGIGTSVAWVASTFFSFTVGMALQGDTYRQEFVATGWTMLRDIANMFFILILVYIAFQLMFQAETHNTMHTLVWVIFIALIINFSFFAVRLAIDAGNILATQFYNQIPGTVLIEGTNAKDMTTSLMDGIGVQTALSTEPFQQFVANDPGFLNTLITLSFIYISVGIMLFMLAATLLMVGVKFLMRIVVLWIAIIAAPLALVASAFPNKKIKGYYYFWQDALLKHIFYPAVFLFVFFILTLFMETSKAEGSGTILGDIFAGLSKVEANLEGIALTAVLIANIAIRLGFVIVILYLGLKAADTLGVYGARAGRSFTRFAGNAMFGTAGFAGRRTVGWAGQRYAQSNFGRNAAANGGMLGRTLWRGAGRLGNASFDARTVPGIRTGFGAPVGVDFGGAGGRGGYNQIEKDRLNRRIGEANKLKPSEGQLKAAEERGVTNAISNMSDEQKANLAAAQKKFAEQEQIFKAGGMSENDFGKVRRAFQDTEEMKQVRTAIKEAQAATGKENSKNYAESISTRNIANLGGFAGSLIPGVVSKTDKEAAARITRGDKNLTDNISKSIKDALKGVTPSVGTGTPGAATPTAPGFVMPSLDELKRVAGGGKWKGAKPVGLEGRPDSEDIRAAIKKMKAVPPEAEKTPPRFATPTTTPIEHGRNDYTLGGSRELAKDELDEQIAWNKTNYSARGEKLSQIPDAPDEKYESQFGRTDYAQGNDTRKYWLKDQVERNTTNFSARGDDLSPVTTPATPPVAPAPAATPVTAAATPPPPTPPTPATPAPAAAKPVEPEVEEVVRGIRDELSAAHERDYTAAAHSPAESEHQGQAIPLDMSAHKEAVPVGGESHAPNFGAREHGDEQLETLAHRLKHLEQRLHKNAEITEKNTHALERAANEVANINIPSAPRSKPRPDEIAEVRTAIVDPNQPRMRGGKDDKGGKVA